jgi:hypothetical protein
VSVRRAGGRSLLALGTSIAEDSTRAGWCVALTMAECTDDDFHRDSLTTARSPSTALPRTSGWPSDGCRCCDVVRGMAAIGVDGATTAGRTAHRPKAKTIASSVALGTGPIVCFGREVVKVTA